METELIIRMAEPEDINLIGWLAQQIWPFAYKDIVSQDQVRYMLNLIYSPESLREQFNQKHQFLIVELDEEPVGFASYSRIDNAGLYKLQKLYVLPSMQGKGLGKAMIDFIVDQLKPQGIRALQLNVNRNNKARLFYEKEGFNIIKEEDIDIGNNYFMNDYVMEKKFLI